MSGSSETLNVTETIESIFKEKGYNNVKATITNKSSEGGGYVGEIYFVKVTATKNDTQKNFEVVLKASKDAAEQPSYFESVCKREVYFYDKVVPFFNKFLTEKGLNNLEFVPECYKALETNEREIIILQNMKHLGYDIKDFKNASDFEHMKITLEAYGKFHAVSFALKDQNEEKFNEVCGGLDNRWIAFCDKLKTELDIKIKNLFMMVFNEIGDTELIAKYQKLSENGLGEFMKTRLEAKDEHFVLSHGDCWNNNFMYKYKDDDEKKSKPTNVCMLDFQFSGMSSVAVDLGYHIYCTCDPQLINERLDELLKIYHKSLTDNIKKLGSDPEKIFPYETFIQHWKKYSGAGCILSHFILTLLKMKIDADKENPAQAELRALYHQRLKAMIDNAAQYID